MRASGCAASVDAWRERVRSHCITIASCRAVMATKMAPRASALAIFLCMAAALLLAAVCVTSSLAPPSGSLAVSTQASIMGPILPPNQPPIGLNWSQPHHRKNPVNFEQLITRILNYIGAPQAPVHHHLFGLLKVSDPLKVAADVNNRTSMRFLQNNKTFASIVYTDDSQRPRKLISCHLLDLEKHTPEVGQLESKYNLRTARIEFKDMMQLIESCTDIERTKPRSRLSIGLAALRALVRRSHQQNKQNKLLIQQHQLPTDNLAAPNQPQQTKLKRFFAGKNEHKPPNKANIVHHIDHSMEAGGHRLVLGEVTAPPQPKDGQRGSIVEALQEISSYDSSDLIAIWRGILPGTNWCGMGDRASSYDHLGFEVDVDICCRAHDFCPIRLSAFSGGYGLFNWSFYTRSHCWCDQNFLECLQEANSSLAAVVTRFYFSIMRTTCLHDNETIIRDPPPYYQEQQQQQQQQYQQQSHLLNSQLQIATKLQEEPRQQQQHLLLDQIKAAAPIPAQARSQPIRARIDSAPTSQLKIHPQDQVRVMPSVTG